jgi:hypothetical protein
LAVAAAVIDAAARTSTDARYGESTGGTKAHEIEAYVRPPQRRG